MKSADPGLFIQSPPRLGNQYRDDALLRAYLLRKLPADMLAQVESEFDDMGRLAGEELYALQLQDLPNEPRLLQWDAWGNRVDRIEVTALWQRAADIAARCGLVAIPYERRHERFSRIHQFALVYLFHPSSDVYTCPLAMTDGAARTLAVSGNTHLVERAVPRLTCRDPRRAWTSGQWMTESIGGSDVGASLTRAELRDGRWRLYGKKWFASSISSQMALTLARPAGNGPGGSGLGMFYVETHDGNGQLNHIRVERLKDKLGTRKVPTAELLLDGTEAELVRAPRDGTRDIEPMLMVTRAWNSVTSAASMRRGVALARAYAQERRAFRAMLADLPLHVDTLAEMEAQTRAAFLLVFELVELLGREESGDIDAAQRQLLRLLTPIAKLLTARQAVSVASEAIEAFGGAGYVEDTGLPALLRDTHVMPIWEGTTNILALDALLRGELTAGLAALGDRITAAMHDVRDPRLSQLSARPGAMLASVLQWRQSHGDGARLQSDARRMAMTIGHAWQLALLVDHAQWCLDAGVDAAAVAAAVRFAAMPIELLAEIRTEDSRQLAG